MPNLGLASPAETKLVGSNQERSASGTTYTYKLSQKTTQVPLQTDAQLKYAELNDF